MTTTKHANVAGQFYPASESALRTSVMTYLSQSTVPSTPQPLAIIAPHAGYMYSGITAALAYAIQPEHRTQIKRIILIGPTHYCRMPFVAACQADAFATPLGLLPSDKATLAELHRHQWIQYADAAFEKEHSLEVHFPFIQILFPNIPVTALIAGQNTEHQVHDILSHLWQPQQTLIIISSDLSHFHPYQEAQQRDQHTANRILSGEHHSLTNEDACGAVPIKGLLMLANDQRWQGQQHDLRNSGDTAGDPAKVVGYGAFQFIPTT